MAARTLSMMAASAWQCRSRGLDIPNSVSSVPCKDFGAVVRLGVMGLRTSGVALRRDVLGFAAGKGNAGSRRPRSRTQSRRKPKVQRIGPEDEDDVEKALEALFAQLEVDLGSEEGNDGGGDDDDAEFNDEEFTDEELAQMTKELEAAFKELELEGLEGEEKEDSGLVDMVMKDGVYSQGSRVAKGSEDEDDDDDEEDFEDFEDDDDDDDEPRMVPLEEWQLRKLAAAVEKGRRNVNVKSLSAELGMNRSDVLSFLRDPPPDLLLMSAQLEEEDEAAAVATKKVETKVEKAPQTAPSRKQSVPPPTTSGGPQNPRSWHGNKRLKKEHVATFERVYRQTNRPSNTMIENLVNLTHVPRKKILQWFDDKRAENQPQKKSFENAPEN